MIFCLAAAPLFWEANHGGQSSQTVRQALGGAKVERSSWMLHWQEISEVVLPRAGRFLVSDNNKGDKRHRAILTTEARERFALCRAA